MNRIDFTKTGGILRTQDLLAFMQEEFTELFEGMAAFLGGDSVIVSGVADLGANYGDGWVVIAGELMPFQGGVKAARIVVQEDIAQEAYGDGNNKDAYYTRYAKCASVGGTLVSAFVRLSDMVTLSNTISSLNTLKAAKAQPVWTAIGMINFWSSVQAPRYRATDTFKLELNGRVKCSNFLGIALNFAAINIAGGGLSGSNISIVKSVPNLTTGGMARLSLTSTAAAVVELQIIGGAAVNDIIAIDCIVPLDAL